MTVGIRCSGGGIGDRVVFAAFPENYYRFTGEKVVDVDKYWVYDYNPYTLRDQPYDRLIDFFALSTAYGTPTIHSVAHRTCHALGVKCHLRHPRLYRFEDVDLTPGRIIVHATGRAAGGLPRYVCDHIGSVYRGYDIVQLGGPDDMETGFRRIITPNIWDAVKLIASSALFIGVGSGLMNIANCYPRVAKKILFSPDVWSPDRLSTLFPMRTEDPDSHWFDFCCQYYNCTDVDIGITYTYLKL